MRGLWLTVAVMALLQACTGVQRAPVEAKATRRATPATVTSQSVQSQRRRSDNLSPGYVVVSGDTLYSVAWRYHLDYRELARWNGIGSSYLIYPGDRLMLQMRSGVAMPGPAAQVATAPKRKPANTVKPRRSATAKVPTPVPVATPKRPKAGTGNSVAANAGKPIKWRWPSKGKFRKSGSPTGKKGLQILGKQGQPVSAAAPGVVVYSGSGLIGYGKLIIIKHNGVFLSAYAHNDTVFVEEGSAVTAGQKIAEMGSSGPRQVMLHFEIRRNGKPVPPLDYLPKS